MNRNSIFYFLLSIFSLIVLLFSIFYFLTSTAEAATNISATTTEHYAWNDVIGWVDFYSTGNVNVTSTQLSGYATSSVGFIALDCATSPNGNICGTSNFKVLNDSGYLSGWAWNDAIGWISFDSTTATSSYAYQVTINTVTGDFSGWAWNDTVGWLSFNCSNTSSCGTSNYKVNTSWQLSAGISGSLISSIFDTQVTNGVSINTVMWRGNKPSGTTVKFQIASSNSSSGPWNYYGPDGSSTTYYTPTDADAPVQINLEYHNNHRYFRYKIFLETNGAQTVSPRVDSVIINWSP